MGVKTSSKISKILKEYFIFSVEGACQTSNRQKKPQTAQFFFETGWNDSPNPAACARSVLAQVSPQERPGNAPASGGSPPGRVKLWEGGVGKNNFTNPSSLQAR